MNEMMTAATTSTRCIINPYLRPPRLLLSGNGVTTATAVNNTVVTEAATMGIQSQNRIGANAKARKKASRFKAKHGRQYAIDGGLAFDPVLHCVICKTKAFNVRPDSKQKLRIPKRPHHRLCSKNRRTKGLSEQTVFVEREAARNLLLNRTPLVAPPSTVPAVANFFARRETSRKMIGSSSELLRPVRKSLANATNLRQEVDLRISKFKSGVDYSWISNKKYPEAVGLVVDYICLLVEHKKPADTSAEIPETLKTLEAVANYRQFFQPGSLEFKFPKEVETTEPPSPYYHALEGTSILLVDWKIAYPKAKLPCYHCKLTSGIDVSLCHDRTNFSKNRLLYPVFTTGRPMWCIIMMYQCPTCQTRYPGNDGRLLAMLDPDVASSYPVRPIYASISHAFQFNDDLTDHLEALMKTYANGNMVSETLYTNMGKHFTRSAHTYLCRSPKAPFLTFEDFHGLVLPPSGSSIRQYYEDAQRSPLMPYGYSHYNRYKRELQSVILEKGETIAFDHTFATVKNFNLPGAKALFTACKGSTKEIVFLAIVPSTGVDQISHLVLESCQKRSAFSPSEIYTDTCPHNDTFWRRIFGNIAFKLGLYHFLHRIVDTLDSKSGVYWKCLVALKDAIYSYEHADESALLHSLKKGTFAKDGKKYTEDEVQELRHSKRWKERCSQYLRKNILPGGIISDRLARWIVEYRESCDDLDRPVFTRNTVKVATEQLTNKAQFVGDTPGVSYYQEIPPGPRSTHQLSKWRSVRPEAGLENFHEQCAHYANTGMNRGLADVLTMAGTCDNNIKQRWKHQLNQQRLQGNPPKGPAQFADLPRYLDHSMLHHLNNLAQTCMFVDCRVPQEDNGEVFLSEYFEAQVKRNAKVGQDRVTKCCKCLTCTSFLASRLTPQEKESQAAPKELPQPSPPQQIQPAPPQQQIPLAQAVVVPRPSWYVHFPPMGMMTHWRPRPDNCCYKVGPRYFCSAYSVYLQRKDDGDVVRGKPPHDNNCPVRCKI